MKKLWCFMTALSVSASAVAEVRFNALERGDAHYAVYQRGLCAGTLEQYRALAAARYRLDHDVIGSMSPGRREAWVIDYAVTTELRDGAMATYSANCR
jgi:hypothetical protein